jgi:hypothetical protein
MVRKKDEYTVKLVYRPTLDGWSKDSGYRLNLDAVARCAGFAVRHRRTAYAKRDRERERQAAAPITLPKLKWMER